MAAQALGKVGMAARAAVNVVGHLIYGKFPLPKYLVTRNALRHDVRRAIQVQERPLFGGEFARPVAVQMDDLMTFDRDAVVRREPVTAPRARRFSHVAPPGGATIAPYPGFVNTVVEPQEAHMSTEIHASPRDERPA